jgi:hypothetical protein
MVRHQRSQHFYKCEDLTSIVSNENVNIVLASTVHLPLVEPEPCCAIKKAGGRCLAANCRT